MDQDSGMESNLHGVYKRENELLLVLSGFVRPHGLVRVKEFILVNESLQSNILLVSRKYLAGSRHAVRQNVCIRYISWQGNT